jgi:flagellar P-ring protein precursor FlgI
MAGEGMHEMKLMEEGVSIYDLVKALNALGVAPKDLIAILQAIKSAGALHADLEFI